MENNQNANVLETVFIEVAVELAKKDPFMKPFTDILLSGEFDDFTINTFNELKNSLKYGTLKDEDINNLDKEKLKDLHDRVENFFKKRSLDIFYNYADPTQKNIIDGFRKTIPAMQKDYALTLERKNKLAEKKELSPLEQNELEQLKNRLTSLQKNINSAFDALKFTLFPDYVPANALENTFIEVAVELAEKDPFMKPFADVLLSGNFDQFSIDTLNDLQDVLEHKGFDFKNGLSPLQLAKLSDETKEYLKKRSLNIFYNYADPKQKKIIDGFKLTIEVSQKDYKITEQRKWHVEKKKNRLSRPIWKQKKDANEIEELQKKMDSLEKNIVGSTNKLRSILFDKPKEKSMTQQSK